MPGIENVYEHFSTSVSAIGVDIADCKQGSSWIQIFVNLPMGIAVSPALKQFVICKDQSSKDKHIHSVFLLT